jgi:hypothetical protein
MAPYGLPPTITSNTSPAVLAAIVITIILRQWPLAFDKTAGPSRDRHSIRLTSNDNCWTLPKTVQSRILTLDNLLPPLNLAFAMFAPGCGMIGMRRKPCRVGINKEPTMNFATNKESTTAVFTHKKRLSLVEVTKHTDVAVVAEPLENITGGVKIKIKVPLESMMG